MESLSYFKNIRVSPKKMRFMLVEIKKLQPQEALDYLMYSPRRTAKVYYKAIRSAIENAKNTLKVSPDVLQFKLLTIEQGPALKRYQPGGRGTVRPIKKRFSHIKIILSAGKEEKNTTEEKVVSQKKVKAPKKAEKTTEKKVVKKVTNKDSEKESQE